MKLHTFGRSMDGLTLYAVSSDGTMGVFSFDPEEMEGIAPLAAQKDYLKKFGFEPPPLPTGFSHHQAPKEASSSQMTPPPSPPVAKADSQAQSQTFGAMSNGNGVNKLIAKRNNKKRVQPKLVGSTNAGPSTVSHVSRAPVSDFPHGITSDSFDEPSASISAALPVRSHSPSRSPSIQSRSRLSSSVSNGFGEGFDDVEMSDAHTSMQVPISSLAVEESISVKGKRKISDLLDDERPAKARTLGGDRAREKVDVKELSGRGGFVHRDFGGTSASVMLRAPPLLNYLSAKVDGSQDLLEARNSEESGECTILAIYHVLNLVRRSLRSHICQRETDTVA